MLVTFYEYPSWLSYTRLHKTGLPLGVMHLGILCQPTDHLVLYMAEIQLKFID